MIRCRIEGAPRGVEYYKRSFRLGIFPALISMVPIINIFFMALLFPLFTVHTTLNFIAIEQRR